MRVIKHFSIRVVMLVLAVTLVSACGGKEERKAKYFERGKTFFAEKNYDKARLEFKNVLQIDPKTAEAYLYLGQIEEKKQNWPQSFGNYRKAAELDPALIGPHVHLAQIYMAQATALRAQNAPEENVANALGLAQEQIKEILSREPENVDGLTLEATLWVHDNAVDKAVEQLERVIKADPGNQSAAMLLASIYVENGRANDAEALLLDAIAKSDNPTALRMRLASFYAEQEMNDKAEEVLRKIATDNPAEVAHWVSLASFLARTNQLEKAEKVLRDAIAADPTDAQRYLFLTEFLAAKRGNAAATEELTRLIEQHPEISELRLALVRLYMADDQKEKAKDVLSDIIASEGTQPTGIKARIVLAQMIAAQDPDSEKVGTLLDEVLQENPRDNDALLLKGKLAAQKGRYEDAIGDFRSVLKDQPNSPEVLQLLAAAHLANGDAVLARDALTRGVENNPADTGLRLALAEILFQSGDVDGALKHVEAVLKSDAYNERALAAKYELLARKNDAAGMEAVAKLMQAGAPENEAGFIREARLKMAQKDYDAAMTVLDTMLAKDPASVAALMAKADVLAAQKDFAAAIPVVEQLQKINPDSETGYYRKGKLLEHLGDTAAALAQYEIALEKEPESAETLTALVNLEVKQSGSDKSEKRLRGLLAANPSHAYANEFLGLIYLGKGDFAEAEKAFEAQLDINPASPLVYAQLAQARMAQNNIAGAADAYQKGLEVMPDNIRMVIGLAGIKESQKDYDAAISLYEKALEQQPDNAVSINNLASLLSDHRTDSASLEKAGELAAKLERTDQPAFVDTAGWVYYRKGDYDKAISILESVVEKAPKVPVFRYHLGMAYLQKGDKTAAREQLTAATEGNPTYSGIEEARATLETL